jgi:cbb3-type cytochrome oxidase subunit 1
MSIALPYRFMLAAVLFGVVGMCLGIWIGINGPAVFNYAPVHAHINLAGWATMFLFGLWYRSVPSAAGTMLASVHFWVALVGAILLVIGIIGAVAPNPSLDFVVIPGALLTLASMLIFLWTVWQASQRGL